MTAQIPEKLKYKRLTFEMDSEPLADYLRIHNIQLPEVFEFSACWRDYVSTWEKSVWIVSRNNLSLFSLNLKYQK